MRVLLPALEVEVNCVVPPSAPTTVPPLVVIVLFPAVAVPANCVLPPDAPLAAPPLFSNIPLLAVVASLNEVIPPAAPLTVPPLVVKVPFPALEVLANAVMPPKAPANVAPFVVNEPDPAEVESKNPVAPPFAKATDLPPSLTNVPLAAVAVLKNCVCPPIDGVADPLLVKREFVPALELLENVICPPPAETTNCCGATEVFPIPAPSNESFPVGNAVILYAPAPALNTIPANCVDAESVMFVVAEMSNVATSAAAFGGPPVPQFTALLQLELRGVALHVALPANAGIAAAKSSNDSAVLMWCGYCLFIGCYNGF